MLRQSGNVMVWLSYDKERQGFECRMWLEDEDLDASPVQRIFVGEPKNYRDRSPGSKEAYDDAATDAYEAGTLRGIPLRDFGPGKDGGIIWKRDPARTRFERILVEAFPINPL